MQSCLLKIQAAVKSHKDNVTKFDKIFWWKQQIRIS